MKKLITLVSVKEACKILADHGFKIQPNHLRAGIECGAYPFGVAVKMNSEPVFEIFLNLLLDWIEKHSMEVEENE